MKDLYFDLINHTSGVTASAVILPQLENSMPYVKRQLENNMPYDKRTNKICIMCHGVSRKIMNYIIAFLMNERTVVLYCDKGVFFDEQALLHTSEVLAERFEDLKLDELSSRTWKLIIDNAIGMDVVRNIDAHIPKDLLSMYDIQLGVTELPVVKMNTYKPTDLQRKQWGITDKELVFSKNRAQTKYEYTTTLYDKLVAYLQLQFYMHNGIEPLYTMEELDNQQVTPYSACAESNAYERACY